MELSASESVPCALVISLLRMHFEEDVRPDIVTTMSAKQREKEKMRHEREVEAQQSAMSSFLGMSTMGVGTSKRMFGAVLDDMKSAAANGMHLGDEWRQYDEIFPALNRSNVDQVSLECASSHVPLSQES